MSTTHGPTAAEDELTALRQLCAQQSEELARERAQNALLIDEAGAMALDEAAAKAYFITAVVTLLATGLGGDVPNLDSFKSDSMKVARRKLEEVDMAYDDLTNGQIKCAAWLLLGCT